MALEVLKQDFLFTLCQGRRARARGMGLNVDLSSAYICSGVEKLGVCVAQANPSESRSLAQLYLLDGEEAQIGGLHLASKGSLIGG